MKFKKKLSKKKISQRVKKKIHLYGKIK